MSQGPHTSRGHVPRHTSTSNDTDDATRILSPQTLADNDSADADATVPLSSIHLPMKPMMMRPNFWIFRICHLPHQIRTQPAPSRTRTRRLNPVKALTQ